MTEEQEQEQDRPKGPRARVTDGIKEGIGVLSAFKDAIEETINEARERGDLSSQRAKDVMKSALDRAQETAQGARERLDLVNQAEFDELRKHVDGLGQRLDRMEAALDAYRRGVPPEEAPGTEAAEGA